MDAFLQKCGLTETQKTVIKEKESYAPDLFAASYEELKGKQIPDAIIKSLIAGRQVFSLEECQNIWRKDFGIGK